VQRKKTEAVFEGGELKMRRWLTILVFVMALAVPAFAQNGSSTTSTTQQSQPAQSSQSDSSRSTTTTTTTQKSSTPVERTTGIDPLYLAIGAVALITIIAIALLAARGRRGRDTVAVRESKTVIRE
jgi:beta-lactamase regulating signal transducer with metallopeptidase domain